MDKYDYVINKPEMEEVLYHAGFHKYIDKYLGKNGKWIYKYAGQAKGAVTGAVNKAKTMLPGLQSRATGAVSTARKAVSTAASSGARTASSVKKQAQKRISTMLPILSKKLNKAKKQARSQAAGVKLVARDKTKDIRKSAKNVKKMAKRAVTKEAAATKRKIDKLKKQADGTYKNVQKKSKNAYYSGKSKVSSAATKARRKLKGMSPDEISRDKGKYSTGWTDDGKARSTSRPYGNMKNKRTGKVELYNNGYSENAIRKNYTRVRGNTVYISSPGAASDANSKYSRLHRQGKKVTAAKANTFRNRKIKNRNSKRK